MLNNKVEYVFLDESIEIRVLATKSNQPKPLQSLSNELVNRILHCHIEKKNDYATSKNLQFGEWEPVKNISVPSLTSIFIQIPNLSQEVASKPKKTIEKKKHLQVVNI